MAMIRFRHNSIASLAREDGSLATEHLDKAGILRQSFKERLGQTRSIDPTFHFHEYLQRSHDLDVLSTPFSHEEIDAAVAELPTDKAPGPDG